MSEYVIIATVFTDAGYLVEALVEPRLPTWHDRGPRRPGHALRLPGRRAPGARRDRHPARVRRWRVEWHRVRAPGRRDLPRHHLWLRSAHPGRARSLRPGVRRAPDVGVLASHDPALAATRSRSSGSRTGRSRSSPSA